MADAFRVSSVRGKKSVYRASCDTCKRAKIRCSQTKPSCTRCLKHAFSCVYGISQRAGKHSAERYNTTTRNDDAALPTGPPTTPSASTGIETLPTPSTLDLGPSFVLSPRFSVQNSNSPDLEGHQHDPWAYDHIFAIAEPPYPNEMPFSYKNHTLFEVDEIYAPRAEHQTPGAYNATFAGVSETGLVPCGRDGTTEHLPYDDPINSALSRATSSQSHGSPSLGTCRCSENIITQLSSLPLFLHHERCPFDVELVQFQEAIRLCAGVLTCTCADKDYTSVLTISMLIGRIISVLERRGSTATSKDEHTTVPTVVMTNPVKSPKFSFGLYQMGIEEESKLKQEVWWLQFKKVESLVEGFKSMVTKLRERQISLDMVQAAAWEKISSFLDQKAQSVKREWMASRDRS